MKRAIFLACLIFPLLSFTQNSKTWSDSDTSKKEIDYKNVDESYLKGAVPEENGRVVFRYSIPTFFQSQKAVFDNLQSWRARLTESTKVQRIYADSTKYEIALFVEDHLRFKPSMAYVDESDISFNFLMKVHPDRCEVIIRDVKYNYVEAQKKIEAKAESMISDGAALSKDGQLSRYFDKFRVHTLDFVWSVQEKIEDRVAGEKIENTDLFKQVSQVPGRFNVLLASDLTLLTFVGEKIENIRLKDGDADLNANGSEIYLTQKTPLKSGDIFTLSFYTEAYRDTLDKLKLSSIRTTSNGLSYTDAWLIVECQMTDEIENGRIGGKILSVWIK